MDIRSVGSICSGIEAASVAWEPLGLSFEWFSEIADFPSRLLENKYPHIPNLGDMCEVAHMIETGLVKAPDVICGGTPCQAFSLAGLKNGLNDDRGNLTLRFVEIINSNDKVRISVGKNKTIVFWENVEGVLTDKTNAFGCLVSSLAGFANTIERKKWPSSGVIHGPERNVAWRVLDAKYFGLPQQRKRLYLLSGNTDFYPESVLFEEYNGNEFQEFPLTNLVFEKDGHKFEVFREYTDCLYSAYGTKWNGNAAAYNGSLFVVQDDRIRRLSPLECERLMGFTDNYTNIPKNRKTNRYQAIGNSWAVPVVNWIGKRIMNYSKDTFLFKEKLQLIPFDRIDFFDDEKYFFIDLGNEVFTLFSGEMINATSVPEKCSFSSMKDIISADAPEDIYISPVGCFGIVRRKRERNLKMNNRLEEVLLSISSTLPQEEIEVRSRVQKRGRFSN